MASLFLKLCTGQVRGKHVCVYECTRVHMISLSLSHPSVTITLLQKPTAFLFSNKNNVKEEKEEIIQLFFYEILPWTETSIHGNLSTSGRPFSLLLLIRSPPLHPRTKAIVYFLPLRQLHSLALTFTLLNWSETALIRGEECSVPLTAARMQQK